MFDDWIALKQQVKEASDIVDVVGSYMPLKPAGPTFKGLCPFHDDHRPSFDVDPRRQRYKCWACSKYGDVFSFVQEFERVGFQEALELLARRAGIQLKKGEKNSQGPSRASMLEAMRWACEQFRESLLDAPHAEAARTYLGERRLTGDTVRKFGLGYAPAMGEWLVSRAANAGISQEMLETVGLIARRDEGRGFYDRFRDRVIFPIRDMRGQVVGFGGRILPNSPMADRAPKYYNSAETPLFSKSTQLFGIDMARQAAAQSGWIAIVEGYTDVMMAHQHGIANVVATMGTALTVQHVKKLRGLVSRVVLVYDADEGGETGVDRALEIFVTHDLDLRVATLPEGLDPCDLLVRNGALPFQSALDKAIDVFEFKLNRVLDQAQGLDGQRRAVEAMLEILAAAPSEQSVKVELMANRIAHRLQLKEETIWGRMRELKAQRRATDRPSQERTPNRSEAPVSDPVRHERAAPAARHEIELMELLLADPDLVARAVDEVSLEEIVHPGLRKLADGLYALRASGQPADLDHLRGILDNERLLERALLMSDRGQELVDRQGAYERVKARFAERRNQRQSQAMKSRMLAAGDHEHALAILRELQNRTNQ
ncbi:MAG: DNA primase [Gemmataceae bacterium]